MSTSPAPAIPKRASFKPAEVCEIAQVKPYVLRSWEAEFPYLGVVKGSGPRVYRRVDLDLVLRLKQMLFVDGLTLGGARRRLDEEHGPVEEPAEVAGEGSVSPAVRQQLAVVKSGLRGILEILSGNGRQPSARVRSRAPGRVKASRGRKKPAKRTRR